MQTNPGGLLPVLLNEQHSIQRHLHPVALFLKPAKGWSARLEVGWLKPGLPRPDLVDSSDEAQCVRTDAVLDEPRQDPVERLRGVGPHRQKPTASVEASFELFEHLPGHAPLHSISDLVEVKWISGLR